MTPLPLPSQTLAWLNHAADAGQRDAQALLHLIARADAQDQWFAKFTDSYSRTIVALCRRLEALERGATDLPAAPVDAGPVANALILADALTKPDIRTALARLIKDAEYLAKGGEDLDRAWAGINAARAALKAEPETPTEALAARPLLEKVAQMGDTLLTGGELIEVWQVTKQAAAWLRSNPPGQPVAIEPRGCPTPGACSCVEPTPASARAGGVGPTKPSGYAYRYSHFCGGTYIKFNGGEEVNGGRPIEAVPYWFAPPSAPATPPAPEVVAGEVKELVAALRADAECVTAGQPDLMQLTGTQLTRIAEILKAFILGGWIVPTVEQVTPSAPEKGEGPTLLPAPQAGEVAETAQWLLSMRELAGEHNPEERRQFTRAAVLLQQQEVELAALRGVPMAELDDQRREAVHQAVAEALGTAYDCLRVWEAWGVGTMGPDDFALTAEDEGRVAEIADAAIEAIRAIPAPAPVSVAVSERPWEREGWTDKRGHCWRFDPCEGGWWSYGRTVDLMDDPNPWTHMAPHNAIPLPVPQVGEAKA